MNKYFTLIISMLILACKENKKINIPDTGSNTLVLFTDAENINVAWNKKNTVIVHTVSEPDNLHPTNGSSTPRSEIIQYTQRTLMYVDFTTQQVVPGLVISQPEVSADQLVFTYTLRDDVKWDDGSPVTADDIVFTAKANKCPLTNNHAVRSYWDNVMSVQTVPANERKFILAMKKVLSQNISFLTGFPILQRKFHDPENILSNFSCAQFDDTTFSASTHQNLSAWAGDFNDDRFGRDPRFLNGLGMYKVIQWNAGESIILERKKKHWSFSSLDYHEVSFPEKIIFQLNKDETSQLLKFRSGESDVSVNVSVSSFIKLNEDEDFSGNYNAAMIPTYNYTYLCLNCKPDTTKRRKIFDQQNVRKAISLLTPCNDIIRLQYKQYAGKCFRMVSNVPVIKSEFNSQLKPVDFNAREAEKLLSEQGWKDSDKNGILDKVIDGKQTELEADLFYLSTSSEWKDIATFISQTFARSGIKINPVGMDLKLFIEKAKSHDFDILLGSWGGTCLPEDYSQLWHTSSWKNHGSNYSGFGDEQSDSWIDSIKTADNDSVRFYYSHKLQKKIYDDQPYVFLYSSLRRNIVHKRFGNQMLFSERPGILVNMLRLLSINTGITMNTDASP